MPVGRPPKRAGGDGRESPLTSPSGVAKSKLPRLEKPTEDFSSVVKNKLQTYTRTGQACDRCKVRKIRCDGLPDGCTHCTQQNLECYVTDRVTGRTERRGYLQQLEHEKSSLLTHIRDLERLLDDRGVQVRPWGQQAGAPSACEPAGNPSPFDADNHDGAGVSKDQWAQFGSIWIKDYSNLSQQEQQQSRSAGGGALLGQQQQLSAATLPPPMLRPIGGHLGVLKDSAPLSSINGTQLSILGTTIDITSFDAPDMDGPPAGTPKAAPIYNKSLQSFYNSTAKVNPPIDAPLPSRDDAFSYSEWFFVMVGAFIPVLHKPSYLQMLARIYDDRDYKVTTPELVIVHMVFAIMYYQFGVRSGDDVERKAQLNELSNKHYHWSLDKVWDIASDVSIAAIQALTLMATHCRGFPKPGPAYLIATLAWNRAIEMNLHRAYLQSDEPTTLENELRKRTWWSLFMVVVMLYGRLGKPMPIHAEDIDVDYPAVVADEYLTEDGILEHEPSAGDCYWLVASAGFRLSFLFMEMWNNVYAVRQDPQHYVDSVRRVELKFQAYQRELPDELRPENCKPGSRVLATYLQGSSYEFLFCLRHPSRCATADPAFLAENYRVSGDAARNMLKVASELARLKSLDTTWYQMAVYVAVVFTLLASQWERRTEITPSELAELKDQVGLGVSVISEILKYIGAADSRIMSQITSVIDRTLASIEQDMTSQRGSRTSTPQYSHQLPARPSKHDEYSAASTRAGRVPRSSSNTPAPMSSMADQQQQQQQQQQQMPVPRLASSTPSVQQQQQNAASTSAAGSYYASPLTSINTAYSQMGYPELASTGVPTPGAATGPGSAAAYLPSAEDGGGPHAGPSHHYMYATSTAAASAAAAAAAVQMGGSPQPAPAAHNMGGGGGYGHAAAAAQQQQQAASSQHHQHHQHQHQHQHQAPHQQHHSHQPQQQHHPHHQQQQPWMPGVPGGGAAGNPWNDWTNAMVDPATQNRYGANALLTLGGGGPGPRGGPGVDGTGGEMGAGGVAAGQSGQWPMLVFQPPNVSGA